MDDLIRGGQVSFHKIRMFYQVSKLFAHVTVFLLIISMGYSYYREINLNEWKIGWNWLKIQAIDDNSYKVTYSNKYGQTRIVSAKIFSTDPFVIKTIQKFETALYKGLTIATIMLSIILGSLILYFWLKGMGIKKNKHLRGIFILESKSLKET